MTERKNDGLPTRRLEEVGYRDREALPANEAAINIQYKNTDLCIDFQCGCMDPDDAYVAHFDGFFANILKCPRCGNLYEMPQMFRLEAGEPTYPWEPVLMVVSDD